MKVRLYTRDHRFVAEAQVPPFNEPPEVLFWGQRVFLRSTTEAEDGGEAYGYREAFAYWIVDEPAVR